MERPELKLTTITAVATVPGRTGLPGKTTLKDGNTPCLNYLQNTWTQDRKVTFTIDLDTWECTGEFDCKDPTLVEESWWKDQCQKVSDRVRSQILGTTA